MKYMMSWTINPGFYKAAVARFLSTGAPLPEGMKLIGRWHAPGSTCGWLLAEGTIEDASEHASEWADLLEMQVTPVVEDAEAGAIAAKVHG
jgi:hypothetical protein